MHYMQHGSLRESAKNYGLNYRTLQRFVKKYKASEDFSTVTIGYAQPRLVLSEELERRLVDYAITEANIIYIMD